MASVAQLRQQIESTLAQRAPSARLALAPRLIAPGFETGYETLDQILQGGFPVAGASEILGSRSSGRTTLAMAYLAARTREGRLCAWIDVAGDLSPEAALANGTDLDRVLWVRCCGTPEPAKPVVSPPGPAPQPAPADLHLVAQAFPEAKPNLRPYNPTRRPKIATPGAPNRPIGQQTPEPRTVQVSTDRLPSRRGDLVLHKNLPPIPEPAREPQPRSNQPFVKPRKPWSRLEQAIKSVDLLVQAGGFGAIVLDLGAIEPQFVRRIPLATWFRWRAALEKARTSLLVLSQASCAGSAAELVLRVEAELPEPGTVFTGLSYRMEVVRRRFAQQQPDHQPDHKLPRKPPLRAQSAASVWHSKATWAAS